MIHRLESRVDKEEVSITGCPEGADVENLLTKEQFDMIIVDNLGKDTEAVCRDAVCIGKAPVTLMVREKGVDWKNLRHLNVDGYLPDEAGSVELMARIRAYSRRKSVICRA